MRTAKEIALQIAEQNTPEKCVGCVRTLTKAGTLARLIVSGELDEAAAEDEYRKDLAQCEDGRLVDRPWWMESSSIICGRGSQCAVSEPAEPTTVQFWEEHGSAVSVIMDSGHD